MIKVILADHQRIFRIGMASALAAEEDIRIVGQPHSVQQLMYGLLNFRPHVLVLSSAFLAAIDEIKTHCDRQQTAILRLEDYQETIDPAFVSRAQGVVGRWADEATMVRSIRRMASGGEPVCLIRNPVAQSDESVGLRMRQRLTGLEVRITSLVVQGYKNREIADELGTTEQSVKYSLRKIFDKAGVFDRLELALSVLHHKTLQLNQCCEYPTTPLHEFHSRVGSARQRRRHTLN